MALKLTPGEKIARGRYILRRYVSRGAHAELWEAEQIGTEGFRRQVAMKIVGNREGLSDPARDSLLREGRLATRLNHPNIIQLYEVGQEERFVYIAMEFVHGADLRQCLRAHIEQHQRALPWHIVARIGALIARGLEHAHNQVDDDGTPLRIVHRDVKPSNVLFSHHGLIKLIDFGIAKSLTLSNNRSVEFKGTVAYVSPEQIRSEELDHRSDLFSFGVLLYELLSGHRPFDVEDGGFGAAMIATLERQPTSLLEWLPDLPPAINQLIFSMLSKERQHRPSSDREVYTALEELLREHDIILEQEHLAEFYDDLLGESDATVYNLQSAEAAKIVQEALRPKALKASQKQDTHTTQKPPIRPLWGAAEKDWDNSDDDDDDSDTIPASAAMDINSYLKSKLANPHAETQPVPIKEDDDDEATMTHYDAIPSSLPNNLPFPSSPSWERQNNTPSHLNVAKKNPVPVTFGRRQKTLFDHQEPHRYAEDLAINTPTMMLEGERLPPPSSPTNELPRITSKNKPPSPHPPQKNKYPLWIALLGGGVLLLAFLVWLIFLRG